MDLKLGSKHCGDLYMKILLKSFQSEIKEFGLTEWPIDLKFDRKHRGEGIWDGE